MCIFGVPSRANGGMRERDACGGGGEFGKD
jgi:hypothetical protein